MIKLPESKTKNGFLYRLVKRTSNTALYSQESVPASATIGFEVFKVKSYTPASRGSRFAPVGGNEEIERFPCNADFGKTAWFFTDNSDAEVCFNSLESKGWYRKVYKQKDNSMTVEFDFEKNSALCFTRDKNTCQSCRRKLNKYSVSAHHIIPRNRGGVAMVENLITLCKGCHDEIEELNFTKYDIMYYKEDSKIQVKRKPIGTEDWHSWIYGGCERPT